MRPWPMSASSAAAIRARRWEDMPTLSGVARGRATAWTRTAKAATRTAHAAAVVMRRANGITFLQPASLRLEPTDASGFQDVQRVRQAADIGNRRHGLDAGPVLLVEVFARQ